MRFIEDHGRIFRQDAAEVVLLQRQIREEEVMVHDNQVGFLRPLVHSRHKARVERRAFLPRASVAPCVQASPQFRIIRQERQLRAIARLRQLRSEEHTSELQSRLHLVCRLLLEKKKQRAATNIPSTAFTSVSLTGSASLSSYRSRLPASTPILPSSVPSSILALPTPFANAPASP